MLVFSHKEKNPAISPSLEVMQKKKKKESKCIPPTKINEIQRKAAREEKRNKRGFRQKENTISKMVMVIHFLSIITLDINGLSSPSKIHKVAESI